LSHEGIAGDCPAAKAEDDADVVFYVVHAAIEFLSLPGADLSAADRTLNHPAIDSVIGTSSPAKRVTQVRYRPFQPHKVWEFDGVYAFI
jgi:hypothetical protein